MVARFLFSTVIQFLYIVDITVFLLPVFPDFLHTLHLVNYLYISLFFTHEKEHPFLDALDLLIYPPGRMSLIHSAPWFDFSHVCSTSWLNCLHIKSLPTPL